MSNSIQDVRAIGQSVWYDNIRRGLIESGELQRLIDLGVTGLTSNPTIFQKAIAESSDYDEALEALAASGSSVDQIYEALTVDDIRAAADLLRSAYDDSAAADGYASPGGQPSPRQRHGCDHRRGPAALPAARPPQRHGSRYPPHPRAFPPSISSSARALTSTLP